ncbi:uncharacterized protein LOC121877370 isoform X2 [Homarus americanus]|uniref:uncharacterized protein LOC121877370 isoform X2 n=1 Tax=Homarus americanus TaxID=6706 RepID=UPI001C4585DC|nr:uncharacterized protein LOC121877370 isoform X2 [Homarus americanus]
MRGALLDDREGVSCCPAGTPQVDAGMGDPRGAAAVCGEAPRWVLVQVWPPPRGSDARPLPHRLLGTPGPCHLRQHQHLPHTLLQHQGLLDSVSRGRLPEPGDCLMVAVKERCRNLFERRGRRKNYARRCEINLPPLVVREEEVGTLTHTSHGPRLSQRPLQRLRCRDDAHGYALCVRLRPLNETNHLVCDPLGVNSKRCSSRHDTVHTRCRLFEVCDQAVVVSGGWSRDLSPEHTSQTLDAAYHMLRHNGFHKGNIKIFYANGAKKDARPVLQHAVYPSSLKLGLRYHLRALCATPLCTDSLLLYLAGPSLNDGTILLWDEDRNGLARGGEVYSPRELLRDVQECAARQVTLLIDTSYAGEIVNAFAKSKKHRNVQVFAVGGSDEYSWGRDFSTHWTHYAHTHACTAQVHQASLSAVRLSTPTSYDGSGGELRRTIFGAPCDVTPPYTWRELHHRYLGCQNTPTALWIRSVPAHFSPPDPKDIIDELFLPGIEAVE